jgi:multiple sugar transport system permease protein
MARDSIMDQSRAQTRRRRRGVWRRQVFEGYAFASPWVIGFLLLALGPMIASIWISLHRWNVLTPPVAVGLANYHNALFEDPRFWKSLVNTAYYAFVSVPLGMCWALLVAVLLNQKVRALAFFRTVFYLPSVVAGVATALVWTLLLNPDFGAVNFILRKIGIAHPPGWLLDEKWAMPGLILMSMWGLGNMMIIYLAGLQNVPEELHEAAEIDGAGALKRFRHVTLPMITPTIFFNLVMSVIGSFQVFMQSYVMTNGGPNDATLTYVLYLYRNAFEQFKMGYASALAWILFVIILSMTLLIVKSSSLWVYYEARR